MIWDSKTHNRIEEVCNNKCLSLILTGQKCEILGFEGVFVSFLYTSSKSALLSVLRAGFLGSPSCLFGRLFVTMPKIQLRILFQNCSIFTFRPLSVVRPQW